MDTIAELFGDGDFSISYDEKGDVLYITFADEEAIGHHLNDHVLVRKNPDTGEIVGITVMHAEQVLESDPGAPEIPV